VRLLAAAIGRFLGDHRKGSLTGLLRPGWEQWLPCLMHESRALYRLARPTSAFAGFRFRVVASQLRCKWVRT